MDVVWHPIKSEANLPPKGDYGDKWLTVRWEDGSRGAYVGYCDASYVWDISGQRIPWDHPGRRGQRVIAWADYAPPAPYEGEA